MHRLKQVITPQVMRWTAVGILFGGTGIVLIKLLAGILAWPYALATFASGEICTIFRFLAVDSWVFGRERPTFRRLWQYHIATALGFAIWWSAANLLELVGVQYLVAAVLAMFFSVGFNMLSNFWWIWRKPQPKKDAEEQRN
jgi:putative flippase GtrA